MDKTKEKLDKMLVAYTQRLSIIEDKYKKKISRLIAKAEKVRLKEIEKSINN